MKIIETLDDLGQLVYEIGCFYGDAAMDESLPEEIRRKAVNEVGKSAVLCARLNSIKNKFQQPDSSKFKPGGISHSGPEVEGGEFVIRKP